MKVRILGINGSPRDGNTAIAVKQALKAAETLPDVETEYYGFFEKTLNPCVGCWKCNMDEATTETPCPQWKDDDISQLCKRMGDFDGFIIGTPVYIGSLSAQLKAFIDRHIMMTEAGKLGPCGHRNKPVGAVVTSWDRQGGHEGAYLDIWRWAILADMPVIGIGPERTNACNYWAATLIQHYTAFHPDGGEDIWWEELNGPEELSAVKHDKHGLKACGRIGKRVAELAKVLKAGYGALPEGETAWPYGPAGDGLGV